MSPGAGSPKSVPLAYILSTVLVAIALVAAFLYLRRPGPKDLQNGPASAEARAYVSSLALSDVSMKATENFMKQQVVEIEGRISNNGPRPVETVDVYCLFHGVDGHEIYRERSPIVRKKGAPLKPSEIRPFRLAFDNLPDGWNQAMPTLLIAQITFAQ
jgi:hypothetical protein